MINNLQFLRAFAAISVVLFHIIDSVVTYSLDTTWLNFLAGWGALGVDLFFVISGFVMLHAQLQHRLSPSVFLQKRLIRIVPMYWGLTALVVLIYLLFPAIFRELQINESWAISSFAFMSWFWIDKHPVVYVGWTLEWEILFYVLFAISLWINKIRSQLVMLTSGLVLLAISSQHLIIIEFLFGIFAAYLYHFHRPARKVGWTLLLVGVGLFLATLHAKYRMLAFDLSLYRTLIWGVPAFFVVLGASVIGQLRWSSLTYLGNASYSIYLLQMLSIPVFYKRMLLITPELPTDVLALGCLVFTVVAGCIVYTILEKPLTKTLQQKFSG